MKVGLPILARRFDPEQFFDDVLITKMKRGARIF